MTPLHAIAYGLLGLVAGGLGTLLGTGGGFVLLPMLMLLHPHEPAANLAAISLAIVCANAISGSIAYARMRRIDYRSAIGFSLAGLPGAVLGAWATQFVDRRLFDPLLGVVFILGALTVLLKPARGHPAGAGAATRTLVERDGTTHAYTPRIAAGIPINVGVGFISTLFGIGGGILRIPVMICFLGFPTHVAAATSQAVLVVLSLAGVVVHAREGILLPALGRIVPLGLGVVAGAQLGAVISSRVHGRWILWGLALTLASMGVRLLFAH